MGIKQVKDGCWTFGDGDKVCYPYPTDTVVVGEGGVINIYCRDEQSRTASYLGVGYKDKTYTASFSKEELQNIIFSGSKVLINYTAYNVNNILFPASRVEYAPNDFCIIGATPVNDDDVGAISVGIFGNNSVLNDIEI